MNHLGPAQEEARAYQAPQQSCGARTMVSGAALHPAGVKGTLRDAATVGAGYAVASLSLSSPTGLRVLALRPLTPAPLRVHQGRPSLDTLWTQGDAESRKTPRTAKN